jgi:hypothetical protein
LVGGPFHFFFEQQNGQKETGQHKKTEIHSTIAAVDLKDLSHPQGIEQLRHWDDNSEQNIEQ